METLNVLYTVDNDLASINCLELDVLKEKEVLLFDIVQAFHAWTAIGINYTYFVKLGNALRQLESLACSVPVINGVVSLHLRSAGYLPYTPPSQCRMWYEASLPNATQRSTRVTPSTNAEKMRISPPTAGALSDDVVSPIVAQARKETQPKELRESGESKYLINILMSLIQAEGLTEYFNEETLTNIAMTAEAASQAGLEAAGAAARSIFNFAAKSIKTVVSTASSLSSVLQVGKHKVSILKELADGGFSKVYLVKDLNNKEEYALKHIICQSRDQVEEAHNELRLCQRFSGHPNIVQLIDHASVTSKQKNIQRNVYLMFPLYLRGTCADILAKAMENPPSNLVNLFAPNDWPFNEGMILKIAYGTLRALVSIHEAGLAHRDLKPHNILLDENFVPVLMDLGSMAPSRLSIRGRKAALDLEEEAAIKCSAAYRAPELTQVPTEIDITESTDIWAFGCTLYCLAFGWSPFENAREGVLKLAIINGRYSFPTNYQNKNERFSENFIRIIQMCLDMIPARRPSAEQLKEMIRPMMQE